MRGELGKIIIKSRNEIIICPFNCENGNYVKDGLSGSSLKCQDGDGEVVAQLPMMPTEHKAEKTAAEETKKKDYFPQCHLEKREKKRRKMRQE